jgi:hypothetical protein
MKIATCFLALAFALTAFFNVVAAPKDLRWDSPSQDHHGSMPLGNGDLTLNAWMTADGDLHCYIGKSDAWDENARLPKVGKVRFHFEPNPVTPGKPFRQELRLKEGAIEISTGDIPATTIRLWVDANHPVIQMTADSPKPMEVTAFAEVWRTNRQEITELQISDIVMNRKNAEGRQETMFGDPDTLVTGTADGVGWFHWNSRSLGPELLGRLQGLTGFPQTDPLLHRAFGAMVTAARQVKLDDTRLRSPMDNSHRFSVFVVSQYPSTPDRWLTEVRDVIRRVNAADFQSRRQKHAAWWADFWSRSWIHASAGTNAGPAAASLIPANSHPVRLGVDQAGGNAFVGEVGRISLFAGALSEAEIQAFAKSDRTKLSDGSGLLVSATNIGALSNSSSWGRNGSLSIEAWVKPGTLPAAGGRLVDKVTPGVNDGFLLDTHPGNSLRLICGESVIQQPNVLTPDKWSHVAAVFDASAGGCRLYLDGRLLASTCGASVQDEAAYVSQMYDLQRFVTACAGRGAYPIKFNGSLFTVPPGPTEKDPDYRRWGPGYWWQNTRLPYMSLCTSGDFDLQEPLFRMYARDLLPLSVYRTKLYLGHDGAYYPECIMFWGTVFGETYGWTPFESRQDKLQESGWHKWEWVGGLELCWMMLDYYDHTLDTGFLTRTALPFTREILTFFDQHYPTNAEGKLVMHPSQALETWWKCTNAVPELAGCVAVSERVLGLPQSLVPERERLLSQRLLSRLPPIPLRDIKGRKALSPAEFFDDKRNIENPELYPVFPFRLFAFNRAGADYALVALDHRADRGHSGWRQDELFMAYLGLTEDARKGLVSRARRHDPGERFPAFWGPNYDWTPDQDHGGVLMKAFQSMLLQNDGTTMYLFPAWPREWNVEFKLHAPQQTTLEGVYRDGKLVSLTVTPEYRRADLQMGF